jgi:plastocyanin
MRRVLGFLAATSTFAAVLTAFAAPPPATAQTSANHKVDMKEFLFMPDKVTIKAGETVTWVYAESASDPMPNCDSPYFNLPLPVSCPGHTATAVDKGPDGNPLFNSGNLKGAGASFSYTFATPGTYHYYCVYHGGTPETGKNNPITNMEGDVVVEASTAAATAPPGGGATASQVQGHQARTGTGAAGELAQSGIDSPLPWALTALAAGLWLAWARKKTASAA